MSAIGTVEVPISQTAYESLVRQAFEDKRSITEFLEETIHEARERRDLFYRMRKAMRDSRADAVLNGTSTMTIEEIDAEIALARSERGLSETSV